MNSKAAILMAWVGVSLMTSPAMAEGKLAGTYGLAKPCKLTVDFGGETDVLIPAGQVVVTENVPYQEDWTAVQHPAILFQFGGDFRPVLALGIGEVAPFAYGGGSTSFGTYQAGGRVFVEQYSLVQGEGLPLLPRMIVLEKNEAGLTLTETSKGQDSVVCRLILDR